MSIGGTPFFWVVKRGMDLCLSLALLPVLVIVTVLLIVLNPILNPGALLFRQRRVGQRGKSFVLIKFRTMAASHQSPRFATSEAHRIPRFGRWLRRYRIDELPQIINVLRGDMSMIGPRPEQPEYARTFSETLALYDARHVVRPGLSGLSQVIAGYTSDLPGTRRKLALDLRYIRNCGFRMEWFVFRQTVITVLTGRGAL